MVWIIPPLQARGGQGQILGVEPCSTGGGRYSPVQPELTHGLQDVQLAGVPELLAPEAAHDKTARPTYACAEVTQGVTERGLRSQRAN